MNKQIYKKIIQKKEFSQLPKKDVELAWKHFEKRQTSDEEKIKLTRDLLRKVFSVFTSKKLLNLRNWDKEKILKKHISTKERFESYGFLYSRLLCYFDKKLTILDFGSGVNGFSYNYFPKKTKYIGIEAIGQLVDLMNHYFELNKFDAKAIHESLFELEKIKKLIKKEKGVKIIFLFKVIDSLEMLERDYSKKLLLELTPLVEKVVVSFATKSLVAKKGFKVKRNWIRKFINNNFKILDDFEIGGERYIYFKNAS